MRDVLAPEKQMFHVTEAPLVADMSLYLTYTRQYPEFSSLHTVK